MTLQRGVRIDVLWYNHEVDTDQRVVDLVHETVESLMTDLLALGCSPAIQSESLPNRGDEAEGAGPLPVPSSMKERLEMQANLTALTDDELDKELSFAIDFDDPEWLKTLQWEKRRRESQQIP